MTRFGIVASPDALGEVMAAGADYLEPTIVGGLISVDGDDWRPGIPVPPGSRFPSFCILFPGSFELSSPDVDLDAVGEYLDKTLGLVASLAEPQATVVFGSGTARRIRDGVDPTAAREAFARVVELTWTMGHERDLEVLVEPLNTSETNLLTSLPETVAYLDSFGLTQVKVVCDWYHLTLGHEGLGDVVGHLDRIGHVHVADTDRRPPGQGDWPLPTLVRGLISAGYLGNVSIECHWHSLSAEAPTSLALMRSALPS